MRLDLNFELKDLSGTAVPLDAFHPGKMVANILAQKTNKMSPAKATSYAVKLWDNGILEDVSKEDTDELVELLISEARQGRLTNLACSQITDHIEKAKAV